MPKTTNFVLKVATIWLIMRGIHGKTATNSSSSANGTTALVGCRLCANANATPGDPEARFQVFGGHQVLTCQQVYEKGVFQLSPTDCSNLHAWGSNLCLCTTNANATFLSNNNCTLCENGSSLPMPIYEGLPSTTCAQLQVEAQRDDPSHCTTWQKTVGVYCQCNNTLLTRSTCQLCGEYPLPNPLLEVGNTNYTFNVTETTLATSSSSGLPSCGEWEFQANLPGSNCSDIQQHLGSSCCQNLILPTVAPKSGVKSSRMILTATSWFVTFLMVRFQY